MFKSALAATALAGLSFSAHAVTIVAWDFEALTAPTGTSTSISGVSASTGTGTASGLHAVAATFSTPSGNGSTKSLSANNWSVGDYWQFAFSTTGYTATSITFDQTGSSTGPRDFAASYSIDGTSFTQLGTYTVLLSTWSPTSTSAAFTTTFALPAAANNAATVFVRLVDTSTTSIGGATVASGGTDRVDNFTVSGTVSSVPEAGTTTMLAAGIAVLGFLAARRRA